MIVTRQRYRRLMTLLIRIKYQLVEIDQFGIEFIEILSKLKKSLRRIQINGFEGLSQLKNSHQCQVHLLNGAFLDKTVTRVSDLIAFLDVDAHYLMEDLRGILSIIENN